MQSKPLRGEANRVVRSRGAQPARLTRHAAAGLNSGTETSGFTSSKGNFDRHADGDALRVTVHDIGQHPHPFFQFDIGHDIGHFVTKAGTLILAGNRKGIDAPPCRYSAATQSPATGLLGKRRADSKRPCHTSDISEHTVRVGRRPPRTAATLHLPVGPGGSISFSHQP